MLGEIALSLDLIGRSVLHVRSQWSGDSAGKARNHLHG
jgi:hypothetical protein